MTEYIKREDALKMCSGEIQNIRYMTDLFGKRFECVVGARRINADEIAEQIKKIPSADVVERKHGKWEVIDVANLDLAYGGRIYVPEFKCNQCGSYYESDVRWVEPIMPEDADFPKFCPNCGADMRHPDD